MAAPSKWTDRQVRTLRECYEQYAGQNLPVAEIAALIGKTPSAVRTKATHLGLTEPGRPRPGHPRTHPELDQAVCPVCQQVFQPVQLGPKRTTVTCSRSCGQRLRIAGGGHSRGMAGKRHTDATKAVVGEASRAMWADMSEEDLEKRRVVTREMVRNRPVSEATHSRSRSGRRADLEDRFFRSAWEANYARWLNYRRDVVKDILSWEYEVQRFDFPVKRGTMSYLPDFKVCFPDGRHEWHEVKGWMTQQGATALKRFAKYYPLEVLVLVDGPTYRSIAKTARYLLGEWE